MGPLIFLVTHEKDEEDIAVQIRRKTTTYNSTSFRMLLTSPLPPDERLLRTLGNNTCPRCKQLSLAVLRCYVCTARWGDLRAESKRNMCINCDDFFFDNQIILY